MALKEITYGHCGETASLEVGHINRAIRQGDNLYCDRVCSSKGRETTKADKVEKKRLYDLEYRNRPGWRKRHNDNWAKNYNPEKAAIKRAKYKKEHPEWETKRRAYMASPKSRTAKSKYDKEYLAKQKYGEYWECGLLATEINHEVKSRASNVEIATQNGILNKATKRKRDYEKVIRDQFKTSPLGNLEWN